MEKDFKNNNGTIFIPCHKPNTLTHLMKTRKDVYDIIRSLIQRHTQDSFAKVYNAVYGKKFGIMFEE